ncbi:hypothetical protein SSX86_000033 [Deinandra increscens subsp. villosa]|uniref:Uncharacterized protein n=1 Tax=Deinandra increscens subsp. villosa TaxID=3103831 RepID=A0AAP0DSE2_9ASTR
MYKKTEASFLTAEEFDLSDDQRHWTRSLTANVTSSLTSSPSSPPPTESSSIENLAGRFINEVQVDLSDRGLGQDYFSDVTTLQFHKPPLPWLPKLFRIGRYRRRRLQIWRFRASPWRRRSGIGADRAGSAWDSPDLRADDREGGDRESESGGEGGEAGEDLRRSETAIEGGDRTVNRGQNWEAGV